MISVIIFLYSTIVGTPVWQYACAIPRFPLFLFGLTCAVLNKENVSYYITIPLFIVTTQHPYRKLLVNKA